jgi:hypothetical protein
LYEEQNFRTGCFIDIDLSDIDVNTSFFIPKYLNDKLLGTCLSGADQKTLIFLWRMEMDTNRPKISWNLLSATIVLAMMFFLIVSTQSGSAAPMAMTIELNLEGNTAGDYDFTQTGTLVGRVTDGGGNGLSLPYQLQIQTRPEVDPPETDHWNEFLDEGEILIENQTNAEGYARFELADTFFDADDVGTWTIRLTVYNGNEVAFSDLDIVIDGFGFNERRPNAAEENVTEESNGCIQPESFDSYFILDVEVPGVIYSDDEHNGEDHHMQAPLIALLEQLLPLAQEDELLVRVTDAWDSDCSGHGNNSTHYEGRGIDIKGREAGVGNEENPQEVRRLALLVQQAAEEAGFNLDLNTPANSDIWIWAEPKYDGNGQRLPGQDHVHVSIKGEHRGPYNFGTVCDSDDCLPHVNTFSDQYSGAAVVEMVSRWQGWSADQYDIYDQSGNVSLFDGIGCAQMANLLNTYTNRGWQCVTTTDFDEALRVASFWMDWTLEGNETGMPFPILIPMDAETMADYKHWVAVQGYIATADPSSQGSLLNPGNGSYEVGGLYIIDPGVDGSNSFARRFVSNHELAGNYRALQSDIVPNLGIAYNKSSVGVYELVVPAGCTRGGNSLEKVSATAASTINTELFCDSNYAVLSPSGAEPVTLGKQVKVIVVGPPDPSNMITKAELKVTDSDGFTDYFTSYTPSYSSMDGTVWEFNWTPGAPTATKYTLSAKAEFNSNQTTHCGSTEVQQIGYPDTAKPQVQILQPMDNEHYTKGTYSIKVLAYDNHEISSIHVDVNGPESGTLEGWLSCGAGCYEFRWNVNTDGSYTLDAKAIDTSGNEETDSVHISVGQVAPINISINLTEGQLITKPYQLQFNVEGGVGTHNVLLSITQGNGSEGGWHKTPPAQIYLWDPRIDDEYSVKLEVFDAYYHSTGISRTVHVQVKREDCFEVREGIWENVTPSISPPRTQFNQSEMVDTGKGLMMFSSNELWKWDGSQWINLTPSPLPASWPNGEFHQVAYDSDRNVLVLFNTADHLWEYNLNQKLWTDRTPNPLPSLWPDGNLGWFNNGFERRMVYNHIQKKVILVSSLNVHTWNGSEWIYVARNETWFWDGNLGTWEKVETPDSNDQNRSIAFDRSRNVAVLYSINDDWSPSNDRTWELEGKNWRKVVDRYDTWTPILTAPNLVSGTSGVYLIGGYSGYLPRPSTIRRELWQWDGQKWTRFYALTGDMPETDYKDASVAYDSNNDQLVLFTVEGETWIYRRSPRITLVEPLLFTSRDSNDVLYGPGMRIEWTPTNDPNAEYYEIQFSEDGGTTWQPLDDQRDIDYGGWRNHHGDYDPVGCGHGFHRCLKRNQVYSYRVRVLDSAKNPLTDWSKMVSGTSMEWPAHVQLQTPQPKGPYPSTATVEIKIDPQETFGKDLQLSWQIIPFSTVTYTILNDTCATGDLQDNKASTCKIRIQRGTNNSAFQPEGASKLAALEPMPSLKVIVTGEHTLKDMEGKKVDFSAWDDVYLYFKTGGDPDSETVFSDVSEDYWAYTYISYLYDKGYVSGCTAGGEANFCPEDPLTRDQQAVILVRAEHPEESAYVPQEVAPEMVPFIDVKEKMTLEVVESLSTASTNYWGAKWIWELDNLGLTAGCSDDPPLYCPETAVTRAQMAVFVVKLLRGEDFVPTNPEVPPFGDVPLYDMNGEVTWQARWTNQAKADNLVQNCGTDMDAMLFFPEQEATRAEMACMVYHALTNEQNNIIPPN